MDLMWGKKTEKWFVGASKYGSIYIFHPDVFATESSHKKDKFWQTLKHEYCHIYYAQITKSHYPVWLNEGLASYVSGKKLVLKDGDKEKLPDVVSYFSDANSGAYMIGQFWVEFLIKKFGKKKLISLIKSFDSGIEEKRFAKKFEEVYGFKYDRSSFSKLIK